MQKVTEILQKQTSQNGGEKLTLFPVDFPVNPTQQQEKERAKKMTDTSGRKCLEQLEKFNQIGSLGKTFLACLIGNGDWYSTKSKLTWKIRGLKSSHHLYCQLVVKTHRTAETDFGLLHTPRAILAE